MLYNFLYYYPQKQIFQNNLIPIFIDCELGTYNPTADSLINSCTKETKAIFLAHTLGNPFEIEKLADFANDKNIWLIEDNCESLGSASNRKLLGNFGLMSSFSTYFGQRNSEAYFHRCISYHRKPVQSSPNSEFIQSSSKENVTFLSSPLAFQSNP